MEFVTKGVVKALGRLPLGMLYVLADSLAFIVRDVVRYRRDVVRSNIADSFPEFSDDERKRIERRFYNFLTDYFVETLRMVSMPDREMRRRMRFEGLDLLEEAFSRGESVILYLGHYCNWEWVTSLTLHSHQDVKMAQIYHQLSDPVSDKLFLWIRSRFGSESVEMKHTLRAILGWKRQGVKSITGFIADQLPGYESIHLFVDFLHHDTPVYTGGERIARKIGAAVFYLDMQRTRRGYYTGRLVKISEDASREPEHAITCEYYRMLETSIRRQPELWLWSHRRWKRTREGWEAWIAGRTTHRCTQ